MSPAPEPRIGDAERDAAIASLGEHFAAGRINKDEFDERSGLAMRARTQSDLKPLFVDLPRSTGSASFGAPRTTGSRQGRPRPPRFPVPVVPILFVLGVLLLVNTQAWWLIFVVGGLFFCAPWHYRRWR